MTPGNGWKKVTWGNITNRVTTLIEDMSTAVQSVVVAYADSTRNFAVTVNSLDGSGGTDVQSANVILPNWWSGWSEEVPILPIILLILLHQEIYYLYDDISSGPMNAW